MAKDSNVNDLSENDRKLIKEFKVKYDSNIELLIDVWPGNIKGIMTAVAKYDGFTERSSFVRNEYRFLLKKECSTPKQISDLSDKELLAEIVRITKLNPKLIKKLDHKSKRECCFTAETQYAGCTGEFLTNAARGQYERTLTSLRFHLEESDNDVA